MKRMVTPKSVALFCLVGAALIELLLTYQITHHRAGGWGDSESAFIEEAGAQLIAYGISIFAILWSKQKIHARVARIAALLSVSGILFSWLGLVNYGHATVLFLFAGLLVKAILTAFLLIFCFDKPAR